MAGKTATTTKERNGRVGPRRQVVIPREILERLHIREGDVVAIGERHGAIVVKPKRVVNQDDVLTPAEEKTVRRGIAQLRRGESKSWRDFKNELAR